VAGGLLVLILLWLRRDPGPEPVAAAVTKAINARNWNELAQYASEDFLRPGGLTVEQLPTFAETLCARNGCSLTFRRADSTVAPKGPTWNPGTCSYYEFAPDCGGKNGSSIVPVVKHRDGKWRTDVVRILVDVARASESDPKVFYKRLDKALAAVGATSVSDHRLVYSRERIQLYLGGQIAFREVPESSL